MPSHLALRRPVPVRAQAAEVAGTKPEKKKATTKAAEGGKKSRKKKDKDEPKRGLSAFMFFCQAQRPKIKEENPSLAVTEVAKILGEKWGKVTPSEKKVFEEQAAQDKKRYEQEIATYRANKPEV